MKSAASGFPSGWPILKPCATGLVLMPIGFGMEVRDYFAPIFQLESPGGRPALAGSHLAAFESTFARLKKRFGGRKFKEMKSRSLNVGPFAAVSLRPARMPV
jgi:hypothetical protein